MSRRAGGYADPSSYRWWVLATTSLGALLAALNTSTLVIALPDLLRSLHIGVLDVTWVLLAYILAQTAAVLTAGRLGDMWGRKQLYVCGFAVFTVMALCSGFAGSAWLLILLRSVAGIGGAMLVANSGALVTDAFPGARLGLALGINGMVLAVGSAVGPILGGWLTTFGWQWVFWFNVPLGVLGTLWSALVLHDVPRSGRRQRIDWSGNVTAVVAMTGLLLALSAGGILGWTHPLVIGGTIAFLLCAPLFLAVERRVAEPLLDLSLFRNRLFTVGNLTQLVNGTARMGLLFLLVFYFQGPEQRDPVTAGLLVTPLAALMFLASPVSGWLSDRIGARVPSTVGLGVTGVALGGMGLTLGVTAPYWLLALWMGLAGAGAGIFQSPNSSSIMVSVAPARRGIASGVRMLVAFTGSMFSIAFVLAIVTSSMPQAVMLRIFSGVTTGLTATQVSPFVNGMRAALLVLAALSLVTTPLSLLRGEERPRRDATIPGGVPYAAGLDAAAEALTRPLEPRAPA